MPKRRRPAEIDDVAACSLAELEEFIVVLLGSTEGSGLESTWEKKMYKATHKLAAFKLVPLAVHVKFIFVEECKAAVRCRTRGYPESHAPLSPLCL